MLVGTCQRGERLNVSRASLKDTIAAKASELRFDVGSVPFDLVRIPPGRFEMGSRAEEHGHQPNELPVRNIQISEAFYLGRYEITQAQYKAVMGINPGSSFHGDALAQDQVTFASAIEFCSRLSAMTGIGIELPTEAQWEYAARAGTSTPFYSGSSSADLDKIAWYDKNSGGTIHPVGLKQPNTFGLYDMMGNVWELTADFLGPYSDISDQDPTGQLKRRGAMRGGAWNSGLEDVRAAKRLISDPMFGGAGMRIAVNTDPHRVRK
jgi:formylglycine-generating enzyme required for sulfatase activity